MLCKNGAFSLTKTTYIFYHSYEWHIVKTVFICMHITSLSFAHYLFGVG